MFIEATVIPGPYEGGPEAPATRVMLNVADIVSIKDIGPNKTCAVNMSNGESYRVLDSYADIKYKISIGTEMRYPHSLGHVPKMLDIPPSPEIPSPPSNEPYKPMFPYDNSK